MSPIIFTFGKNERVCLINKSYTNIFYKTCLSWSLKMSNKCCCIQLSPLKNFLALFLYLFHLLRKASVVFPTYCFQHCLQVKRQIKHLSSQLSLWLIFYVFWVIEDVKLSVILTFLHTLQCFLVKLNDPTVLSIGYS